MKEKIFKWIIHWSNELNIWATHQLYDSNQKRYYPNKKITGKENDEGK